MKPELLRAKCKNYSRTTSFRHCKKLWSAAEAGTLIVGSGGLRKIRWASRGRGKSSGVRIIYYWTVSQERILMLFMYPKSERDDLTPAQVRLLRQIVEKEYP